MVRGDTYRLIKPKRICNMLIFLINPQISPMTVSWKCIGRDLTRLYDTFVTSETAFSREMRQAMAVTTLLHQWHEDYGYRDIPQPNDTDLVRALVVDCPMDLTLLYTCLLTLRPRLLLHYIRSHARVWPSVTQRTMIMDLARLQVSTLSTETEYPLDQIPLRLHMFDDLAAPYTRHVLPMLQSYQTAHRMRRVRWYMTQFRLELHSPD